MLLIGKNVVEGIVIGVWSGLTLSLLIYAKKRFLDRRKEIKDLRKFVEACREKIYKDWNNEYKSEIERIEWFNYMLELLDSSIKNHGSNLSNIEKLDIKNAISSYGVTKDLCENPSVNIKVYNEVFNRLKQCKWLKCKYGAYVESDSASKNEA